MPNAARAYAIFTPPHIHIPLKYEDGAMFILDGVLRYSKNGASVLWPVQPSGSEGTARRC